MYHLRSIITTYRRSTKKYFWPKRASYPCSLPAGGGGGSDGWWLVAHVQEEVAGVMDDDWWRMYRRWWMMKGRILYGPGSYLTRLGPAGGDGCWSRMRWTPYRSGECRGEGPVWQALDRFCGEEKSKKNPKNKLHFIYAGSKNNSKTSKKLLAGKVKNGPQKCHHWHDPYRLLSSGTARGVSRRLGKQKYHFCQKCATNRKKRNEYRHQMPKTAVTEKWKKVRWFTRLGSWTRPRLICDWRSLLKPLF